MYHLCVPLVIYQLVDMSLRFAVHDSINSRFPLIRKFLLSPFALIGEPYSISHVQVSPLDPSIVTSRLLVLLLDGT